ncbi:MAG: M3 family oligoendopeptidase [Chitinophagales bacterium]|nr:M3 family oligoendopeptidase [Chitinophagales bacterium]
MNTVTELSSETIRFSDIQYQRPEMEEIKSRFNELLAEFTNAKNAQQQNEVIAAINLVRNNFYTAGTVVSIRHTVDTTDAYYEGEQDYFDKNLPEFEALNHKFYQVLVKSPFRKELEAKWGVQLFALAEVTLKTFDPVILEDLKKENELKTEYMKLIASAKVLFEGEERNLSGLVPFEMSVDRDMRKKASEAKYGFLNENQEKLDKLFDDLVQLRNGMAKKLGFKNFVELGYARMTRTDYSAADVKYYRDQILKHIVPVTNQLRERQAKRLGLDTLKYYDENLTYKTGNATPKGDPDWIIAQGKKMYKELSKETDVFFNFMTEYQFMDLVNKKGKAGGGYCTFLPDYKAPFIFSNFNGTSHDIDVLTHEAGHAFQAYMSRNFEMPEYYYPTFEACEIHSMSMEFFAWPWMENFFKEDTAKYKFAHLSGTLLFLPYGAAVDEFQHFVYENPEATPAERRKMWRVIEKKYLPHRDYDGNAYLENGGFWQKQAHIYQTPFYYIDYTLAEICALQFWTRASKDNASAWNDYVQLCKAGGSQPFLSLVKLAGLQSPFSEGVMPKVVAEVNAWLAQVDDTKL